MELSFAVEDLQKKKLFLATPMYGGNCSGFYTKSVADLTAKFAKLNIPLQLYYLFNESLITRARNYCVDEFLRTDATHMLFIDSDIGFNPDDVIALLGLQTDDSPYDVIGGPYPKKCISWEKIIAACNKGVADADPNILENFVGDYVFNPKSGQAEIRLDEPVEVREMGTGFMMIRRKTFDVYKEAYPSYSYKPDHVRTAAFDGSREIHAYFDCIIDRGFGYDDVVGLLRRVTAGEDIKDEIKEVLGREAKASKRYLSEDYMFCYNLEKIGLKTWLCPWMHLQHVGSYTFGGSLAALASIGASATADISKLGKRK